MHQHVDTNVGVDFERAKARLDADAGRLFRKYRLAKTDERAEPTRVKELCAAYMEARDEARALKPDDHDAIRAALGDAA